jgi:5'-nucleotidase
LVPLGRSSLGAVTFLLLTNDDGIEAPALVPFAKALRRLGRVEVVVPDRERSWIGKAITRHDEIRVKVVEREGVSMRTTTGYPADCTQLGVHLLFDETPSIVISGINIGYNHGAGFLLSSGTIGAAAEGWISGVPAIAFSAGTRGDWDYWSHFVWTDEADEMWNRLVGIATDIVESVIGAGGAVGADVLSVNLPGDAGNATARRVTSVARVGYDHLFEQIGEDLYSHRYGGGFRHMGGLEGTDIQAAEDGVISITPIVMPQAGTMDPDLVATLERGG